MSRHTLPHKYGDKTSRDVRATLLSLLLEFVRETRGLAGVTRIALLGSLLTTKPFPKDADVLVTMGSDVDFERLAQLGRKLKGRAQGLNSGADIFLADASGVYVGRICHYRKCFPRRACQARHCGKVAHLNDDLDIVTLSRELVGRPPLVVYPVVEAGSPMPPDVEEVLVAPLLKDGRQSA
jgi:uncharacterized protein DUF6932